MVVVIKMPYCDQCGVGIREQARFCHSCGTDMTHITTPEEKPPHRTPHHHRRLHLPGRAQAVSGKTIQCNACGGRFPETQKFCNTCGNKLAPAPVEDRAEADVVGSKEHLTCRSCNAVVSSDNDFCTSCGEKFMPEKEVPEKKPEQDRMALFRKNLDKAYKEGKMPKELYERNLKKLEEGAVGESK